MKTQILASEQVEAWLKQLPPESKGRVRRALKALARAAADTRPLTRELEGYHRLRVGPYRIIFSHDTRRIIRLLYAETRDVVYERFLDLLLNR